MLWFHTVEWEKIYNKNCFSKTDVKHGLLDVIGQTPIVLLNALFKNVKKTIDLYAKLEYLNPGRSAKDRSGYNMMLNALQTNKNDQDSVIIESSSGNLGIALVLHPNSF